MSILSNDITSINQILPHKYKWAWDLFLKALKNTWVPTKIGMAKDIQQWNAPGFLQKDEKLLVKRCLGLFAGAESLVGNNLLLSIFKYVNDGECRTYISRQLFEEGLHNLTVVYVCDSLNLDIAEVYEAYKNIPSVKKIDDFLINLTKDVAVSELDMSKPEDIRKFLKLLVTFYVLCEGMLFYSAFASLLSLGRQNKMPGLCEQIQYTLRDECVIPETELLTINGWKEIQNISYNDKIAQYNCKGDIEFVNIVKLSKHKVNKVYSFTSKEGHVNLVTSENHRMIIKQTKTNVLSERTASEINYHTYCQHLMAGNKSGGSISKLSSYEKFLIAFQADGSFQSGLYRNGNQCGYITVSFNFKKLRKINRLTNILNDIGFKYKTSVNTRKYTIFKVQVPTNINLHKELVEWVGNLDEKTIQWCQEFIDEIGEWDEHFVKDNCDRITYGSVIKSNCDVIQAIACLAGYRTHYTVIPDDRSDTFSDYHRIQICKHLNSVKGWSIIKQLKEYDGYVYGVEVPSGMIVVRYKEAVAITGNSIHVDFGVQLINQIRKENPGVWDFEFDNEITDRIKETVEIEQQFAKDILPNGIIGISERTLVDYTKYVANIRMNSLGMTPIYKNVKNSFEWLSEVIEMPKMKNFFESTVIEYQSGGLEDDL